MFTLSKSFEKLLLTGGLAGILAGAGLAVFSASSHHLHSLNPQALQAYQLRGYLQSNIDSPSPQPASSEQMTYSTLLQRPEVVTGIAALDLRDDICLTSMRLTLFSLPFLLLGLYSRSRRILRLENRVACLIQEHEGTRALLNTLRYEGLDNEPIDQKTSAPPSLRLLE